MGVRVMMHENGAFRSIMTSPVAIDGLWSKANGAAKRWRWGRDGMCTREVLPARGGGPNWLSWEDESSCRRIFGPIIARGEAGDDVEMPSSR